MIIIYTRKDLVIESKNKPCNRIEYYDFRASKSTVDRSDMTIFIDDDGDHKILKNKFRKNDPETKELLKYTNIGLHTD